MASQPMTLAPRENMALTLADSFLNDLDDLEEDGAGAGAAAGDAGDAGEAGAGDIAGDLDDLDDMDDESDDGGDAGDAGLDAALDAIHAPGGQSVADIARLAASDRYRRHMAAIDEYSARDATAIDNSDDDREYLLIVESGGAARGAERLRDASSRGPRGADRGDAAGRDVASPRGQPGRTKIDRL